MKYILIIPVLSACLLGACSGNSDQTGTEEKTEIRPAFLSNVKTVQAVTARPENGDDPDRQGDQ